MRRILFHTLIVGLVAGGPMVFFSAPKWWANTREAVSAKINGWSSTESTDEASTLPNVSEDPVLSSNLPSEPLLEGDPAADLGEVLRFDVTTGWIMRRWPRVTTGLSHLQLQGYRVPLVTGTGPDDLAGALTYYFNPAQQVQKITFQGTTGNATRLIRLLTTRFHFARRIANDASLFLYEVPTTHGPPKSVLQVRPARILKANEPYRRFEVALVIERPEE